MNKLFSMRVAMLAAFLATGSGFTSAQDAGLKLQTSAAGIEYVSGGIGSGQREAMKEVRKDYNLRLRFARPKSGDYLADVKVSVENKNHEKVLDVVAPGPLLYVKLPADTYKVTAEHEHRKLTKTTTIHKNKARELVYYFPKNKR